MTKTFCIPTAHIPIRHPETEKNASQTLGNHNTEVSIYGTLLQHLPKRLLLKPSYHLTRKQINTHLTFPFDLGPIWGNLTALSLH